MSSDQLDEMRQSIEVINKVKDFILSDSARMAALGLKDETELGELSIGALYAYGHGAALAGMPPIWPLMRGKD